jgi:hypothetical protein
MLTKSITRSTTPGSPGISAVAYIPAAPGQYLVELYADIFVYSYGVYIRVGYSVPISSDIVQSENPHLVFPAPAPAIIDGQIYMFTTRSTYNVGHGAVPAIAASPAIPTSVQDSYHIGWNEIDVSRQSMVAEGAVTFGASAGALGTYAGLVPDGVESNPVQSSSSGVVAVVYGAPSPFSTLTHAILFSHNLTSIYESGVLVADIGTYLDSDKFMIRRIWDRVEYLKNSVVQYTSLVPSSGEVRLAAMLYSGGDSVL